MLGKSLNIRSIMILMLLTASVGSILVIGFLSWNKSRSDIQQSVFDHLTSVRAAKAQHIEWYFHDLRSQLASLAEEETTIRAMVHLNRGFRELSHEVVPDAWTESLTKFYESEFFTRLQSSTAGAPNAMTYIPPSQAGRYLQYYYLAANDHPVSEKAKLDDAGDGSEYSVYHLQYHPVFRDLSRTLWLFGSAAH